MLRHLCFRRGNRLARALVFSDGRRVHRRWAQGRRQGRPSHGVAESAGDRRNDAADRARASTSQRLTQEFLAAHPDDYYAHGYLGYIYLQMGDLAHAEEEYSRS